ISRRHLIRILQKLGLKRKGIVEDSLESICTAVIDEIFSGGSCIGYKRMWQRLRLIYGLKVKRSTVDKILHLADPNAIEERSRRRLIRRKYTVPGPNFLWHIDGYDKLKPFGFAIHGCIDGFSRKVLWLDVATSNNKPEIIAYYYLTTVQKLKLVPTLIRSDYGTENCLVEALQQSLRFYHDDSLSGWKSFIKGKSTSNQRIESYWSQLRRHGLDFWINLFKDLRERDFYNDSSMIHVECLRFCFGHLIRAELETIRHEWNRHRIRKQKNRHIAPGKPNCLYYLPEVIGAKNYMKPVNEHAIDILKQDYTLKPKLYNEIFCQLVKVLIPDIQVPLNVEESVELYLRILNLLKVYT
ncbi:GSCOCG00012228001-RA-CDS, partial [Cotesia congregata]